MKEKIMEQQKRKFSKVGTVWEKKDGSGFFIKLGNENKKNDKYDIHVELVVKDKEGNILATQKDGFLTLSDPRQSQFANEGLSKVPGLKFEILVANQ
jgi:hypothetical protein